MPPTKHPATVFCRLTGVPPLQPHSDLLLLRCGEVPQGWHVARVHLRGVNATQVAKHMLLPDECRLGYVYYLVALNLGLPLRSFRLEATEGSDARPLPHEGPLEDYVDVTLLGGLHMVP
eukprot:10898345-Prorocentrum_lima.AAC.1